MAFNDLQSASGPYFVAPGQSVQIVMWYGDPGDDHGAQWIMAHPIANETQPPATLQVSDFRKILDYSVGSVSQNGGAEYRFYNPYYRYGVRVSNVGDYGVFFSLQGGGNT